MDVWPTQTPWAAGTQAIVGPEGALRRVVFHLRELYE